MRRTLLCLSVISALPAPLAFADDKPARLDAFAVPGVKVRAADADAPLAEGWPKGTEPGMVEVKNYPAYRSAVARAKGASLGDDDVLFYPLFNHITRSDIAMTSPVVSTYAPEMVRDSKGTGDVSMEFVYRSPDIGKAGRGVGAVKVEDHPASAFVCLGIQGEMNPEKMRLAVEALKSWLAEHKGEWVEDGPPRRLGYHAPMVRRDERLWEAQVPIKPASKPSPEARQ